MTSTADALEVMAVVTVCHRRTAPRMDDEQVTLATATVWAELFDRFDFDVQELIAAVKKRAEFCPDAPEPADIIRVARSTRSERMERDGCYAIKTTDDEHYPGDAKAAPDMADYPREWTSDQRLAAYWHALRLHAFPRTTAGWEAIAKQLAEATARREAAKAEL